MNIHTFRDSSTLKSYDDCPQDLASGLKLNFCFSGRMGHVVIGEKLHEQCVLFMGEGVSGNQLEQQKGFSTVTPGQTAARYKHVSGCNYDTINNKI